MSHGPNRVITPLGRSLLAAALSAAGCGGPGIPPVPRHDVEIVHGPSKVIRLWKVQEPIIHQSTQLLEIRDGRVAVDGEDRGPVRDGETVRFYAADGRVMIRQGYEKEPDP